MVHTYQINGMALQTGDIVCTMNGKPDILPGEFWRLVGRLVPGDVDHVAIYVGPNGRCVEAGARGVISFNVPNGHWDTERMARQRGHLFDTFYGIASPLDSLGISEEEEMYARAAIAKFTLAQIGKPYNLNFLNAETEEAYYCSQLAYKAYKSIGINYVRHHPYCLCIVGCIRLCKHISIWSSIVTTNYIAHNKSMKGLGNFFPCPLYKGCDIYGFYWAWHYPVIVMFKVTSTIDGKEPVALITPSKYIS